MNLGGGLGLLGTALKEGVGAYQTSKKIKDDKEAHLQEQAMKKRQYAAGLAEKACKKTPQQWA